MSEGQEQERKVFTLTATVNNLGGITSGRIYGISIFRMLEAAVTDIITVLIVLSTPLTLIFKIIVIVAFVGFFTVLFIHGLENEDIILYAVGAVRNRAAGKVYILSPSAYVIEKEEKTEAADTKVRESFLWKMAKKMEK